MKKLAKEEEKLKKEYWKLIEDLARTGENPKTDTLSTKNKIKRVLEIEKQREEKMKKEKLKQKLARLNKEITEKREELIETKKEYNPGEGLPAHIQAMEAILNHKIQTRDGLAGTLA